MCREKNRPLMPGLKNITSKFLYSVALVKIQVMARTKFKFSVEAAWPSD